MSKEKQLTIQLLEAKIERITGKKVVYQESKKDLIKKLTEKLEIISGKKVAFKENAAAPASAQAQISFITALANDPVISQSGGKAAIPTAKQAIAKLKATSTVPAVAPVAAP